MSAGKGKQAPGIKVRTSKRKPVLTKLYDESGEWLATVRWRPCGVTAFELAPHVKKAIAGDR